MTQIRRYISGLLAVVACVALLEHGAVTAHALPALSESLLKMAPISEYVSSTGPNYLGLSQDGKYLYLCNNASRTLDGWRPSSEYPSIHHTTGYFLDPKGGTYDIHRFHDDGGRLVYMDTQYSFAYGCIVEEGIACGATEPPKEYTLTIEYVYEDGREASPTKTYKLTEGKEYSYDSPSVLGYAPDQATVTGTMTGDKTVRVVYKPKTYTLTINYRYSNGSTASASRTYQLSYGQRYAYPSPTISGYTASPLSVTGTMPAGNTTITVTYTPTEYTLLIQYIYEDGSTVKDAQSYKLTQGSSYSYPSPEVRGHTPDIDPVAGTMPGQDKIVTVTYRRNKYKLTILYVYEDGTKAAPDKVVDVTYGEPYSYVSPTISGYTPDFPSVSGLMLDKPQTVKVTYYRAKNSLTINYVLETGTQAFPTRVYQVEAGKPYSYPSPGLAGYTPDIRIVEGTMPSGGKTVTVTYRANMQNLTIEYVYEDGRRAAATLRGTFSTGQRYHVRSPIISGYYPNYSVVQGNMPTHGVTITVTYYKIGSGPHPDVDESGPDDGGDDGSSGSSGSSGGSSGGSGGSSDGSSGGSGGGSGSGDGGGSFCPDCGCDTNHCQCGNNPDCPCGGNCHPAWHVPGHVPDVTIPPGGYLPDGWEMDFGIGDPEDEIEEPTVDWNFWNPDDHTDGALQFKDTAPLPEVTLPEPPKVEAGEVPPADDPLDPDQYGYEPSKQDLYYYLEKYFGIDGRAEDASGSG